MKRIVRKVAAGCLFAGIVAGLIAPGFAFAHSQLTLLERGDPGRIHAPEAPRNLRARYRPQVASPGGWSGLFCTVVDAVWHCPAVTLSWDHGHFHIENAGTPFLQYQIYLLKNPAGTTSPLYGQSGPDPEGPQGRCNRNAVISGDCVQYTTADTSATIPYVELDTTYYVYVKMEYTQDGPRHYATTTITTSSETETPTEPETPTDPETPTEPETPTDPETPTEPETPDTLTTGCTYKHRFTGVPGKTANAYIGQIRISSELPNATATIRAYQSDNGHRIDVLNDEGHAVENVSLAPANSVKRFRIEDIQGWHPVIVTHPSESAMQAATVAMRIREPGGSIEDSYPPGIEHCQPATASVSEAPDLTVRGAQAVLWPNTLDWFSTVENIGDAPAQRTSVRLYYGERLLATQAVRSELAASEQWPMSHGVSRSGLSTVPRVGSRVRICVDPVPGEPESKHANNCANVTVESN